MKRNVTFKKRGFNAVLMLSLAMAGFSAQAQQTTGDVTKQGAAAMGTLSGSTRVIDNKGTIKYLQVKNGLTQITNTAASGAIVTTWQLGGTLTDNTYIDASGKTFALDGIELATGPAATVAGTGVHDGTTGNGYTFLVRDEKSGKTMKLMPADLVKSGVTNYSLKTGEAAANFTYGPTGSVVENAAFLPSDVSKVSVYRNGVKLLANDDYTVVAGATPNDPSTLTVKVSGGTDPEDYSLIVGDRVEIQWIN